MELGFLCSTDNQSMIGAMFLKMKSFQDDQMVYSMNKRNK